MADLIQIYLGVSAQVGFLGQVLVDQCASIFIGATNDESTLPMPALEEILQCTRP